LRHQCRIEASFFLRTCSVAAYQAHALIATYTLDIRIPHACLSVLLHAFCHLQAVSIAEDVSGMPALGRPVEEGGLGFDYRLGEEITRGMIWIMELQDLRGVMVPGVVLLMCQ
jgi:hypothetical protein